jgi:hypothetical protein
LKEYIAYLEAIRDAAENKALREELSPLEGRKVIDHVKYTDSLERKVLEQKAQLDALREAIRKHKTEVTKTCSDGGPDIRLWKTLEQEE